MLINDSTVQQRHQIQDPKEFKRHQLYQWLTKQLEKGRLLEQEDVTNLERQKGRMMFPHELEAIIKKLVGADKCDFVVHPHKPSKKVFYFIRPNQERWFVCAYENNLMPEWSVLQEEYEDVVDKDVTHIDKKNTGFRSVRLATRETVRGWRTVLINLVRHGLVSPERIERIVGGADRASWNKKTGKRGVKSLV